jgi:hypothetical protein
MRAAMRNASLRRLLQCLALAATFALALVPTVGRVAQACQTIETGDAWGAMCTAAGLAVATNPHPGHDAHAGHAMPAPMPVPHHGGGEDCPYCPLLQALVAPSVPMLPVPAAIAADAIAQRNPVDPTRFRHPNGLGSRGPPSIS